LQQNKFTGKSLNSRKAFFPKGKSKNWNNTWYIYIYILFIIIIRGAFVPERCQDMTGHD
jgi:hypothetical protein